MKYASKMSKESGKSTFIVKYYICKLAKMCIPLNKIYRNKLFTDLLAECASIINKLRVYIIISAKENP